MMVLLLSMGYLESMDFMILQPQVTMAKLEA